jgi:hypothetical protein
LGATIWYYSEADIDEGGVLHAAAACHKMWTKGPSWKSPLADAWDLSVVMEDGLFKDASHKCNLLQ